MRAVVIVAAALVTLGLAMLGVTAAARSASNAFSGCVIRRTPTWGVLCSYPGRATAAHDFRQTQKPRRGHGAKLRWLSP
jgi:hypothetical protein